MSQMNDAPMSANDAPWPEASIDVAQQDAVRLAELLQLEFEALKLRDLTAFDALQLERSGG